MNKRELKRLAEKYFAGTATEEEKSTLHQWYDDNGYEGDDDEIVYTRQENAHEVKDRLFRDLQKKMHPEMNASNHQGILFKRIIWSIAAMLLLVLSIGLYFQTNKPEQQIIAKKEQVKPDIAPGGNKAILTLADGSRIMLDDAFNGKIATQSDITITKPASGQVVYSISASHQEAGSVIYNTIATPRGGQYQINLPDGTKVWLNAASQLRFPTTFKGDERKVELTGEAYFEVAKNRRMPFKVVSGDQTVEVLGTHFNINAYEDEASKKTTLIEGSVKVSQFNDSQILGPGQQAKVTNSITVTNVDTEEVLAWRNGYFIFSNENIQSVMRKISRWYDVDIEYQGNLSQKQLWGSVSKFGNISEVLDILELTGAVHFKIISENSSGKERRIIVMP